MKKSIGYATLIPCFLAAVTLDAAAGVRPGPLVIPDEDDGYVDFGDDSGGFDDGTVLDGGDEAEGGFEESREAIVDICTPGCDAEYRDDWDRCGVWMEPSRNECRWGAYWEWVDCNSECYAQMQN